MKQTTTQAYNTFRKVDGDWAVHAPGSGQGDTVTVSKRDGTTKSIILGKMVANDTFAIAGASSGRSSDNTQATPKQVAAIERMACYMGQYVRAFDSHSVNPEVLSDDYLTELRQGVSKARASQMIKDLSWYLDDEM